MADIKNLSWGEIEELLTKSTAVASLFAEVL